MPAGVETDSTRSTTNIAGSMASITASPTVPCATTDSPHLDLKIDADRLTESVTVRSSSAITGITNIVASRHATPSSRDVIAPATRNRSAMACSTRPTTSAKNVHVRMRLSFAVATLMPSATVGSWPRNRRSAITVTTTLQYVVMTDPIQSTGATTR